MRKLFLTTNSFHASCAHFASLFLFFEFIRIIASGHILLFSLWCILNSNGKGADRLPEVLRPATSNAVVCRMAANLANHSAGDIFCSHSVFFSS